MCPAHLIRLLTMLPTKQALVPTSSCRSVLIRLSKRTNNGPLQSYITIPGQKLETVDLFKYIGVIICDEGSKDRCSPELLK